MILNYEWVEADQNEIEFIKGHPRCHYGIHQSDHQYYVWYIKYLDGGDKQIMRIKRGGSTPQIRAQIRWGVMAEYFNQV